MMYQCPTCFKPFGSAEACEEHMKDEHGLVSAEVPGEEPTLKEILEEKSLEELKEYAETNGIDIGSATSEKGIIKKILEASADPA